MKQLDLYNSRMSSEQRAQELTPADIAALIKSHEALEGQVEQLKHQLAWFKKQLFGRKSERRLLEPSPQQMSLSEHLVAGEVSVVPTPHQVKSHMRRRRQPADSDEMTGGLRFDDERVPVEVIELEDPATRDVPRDQLEVIGWA